MKFKEMRVAELVPYENNPRNNEKAVDYVANSIREFGFKVPLVIDKDNVVVCGHTRLKAAVKLGLETVPCVLADDLTDDQVRAYRIADNKTSEMAGWKTKLLESELKELGAFDVEQFGFAAPKFGEYPESEGVENSAMPEVKMVKCPHCGAMHEARKVRVKYD